MPRKIQPILANDAPSGAVYLTAAQVRARYGGVSHMWIERLLKRAPDFPRPVTLGGSILRFWRLSELETWERACAAKKSA